jgi:murein L,D-transpeptidase YcbB/YkuD
MPTHFTRRALHVARISLASLSLLLLTAAKPTLAQTSAIDPIAQAIATEFDLLLQPDISSIQGAHIALIPQLHDFYSSRGFRPAWSDRQSIQQLLNAIAESEADGLDPNDYHATVLKALAAETDQTGAPPAAFAQFDVLLTEALLRLGYHLKFGKVDAESLHPQWNYGRTIAAVNLAETIEQMINSGELYKRIEALKPTHPFYKRIKRELARLRAIDATQQIFVPAGPSLRPGDSDARVMTLRARLQQTGDMPATIPIDSPHFDADVVAAAKRFQQRMGLIDDGVVGKSTQTELNVPIAQRIRQLRVSLDRGRVLLQDLPEEFIIVNVSGYSIALVRGEQIVWEARAQVGKPYRQTPVFRSDITYLVFNPTWTVPPGIIENDILPDARRDPNAITRRGLKVIDRSGSEVDPATVDWSRFKSGHIPYTLRQDPGPQNALGRVKFMFPNAYHVYLHDTPSKGLFEREERTFSSGCVRVERATELAELLLENQTGWDKTAIANTLAKGQIQNVTLKRKTPVLLTYWTAWVDAKDRLNFRRDIYDRDALWAAGLDEPFKLRARPLFE